MTIHGEIRRIQNALQSACRFLLVAILVQLPFLIVMVVRFFYVDFVIPSKLYWFFNALSSLLAIIGFSIVRRQLGLWDEAMENAPLRRVMQPRTIGGLEMAIGIQMLFYLIFLVPVLNLPAIFWGRARAKAVLHDIDAMLKALRQ